MKKMVISRIPKALPAGDPEHARSVVWYLLRSGKLSISPPGPPGSAERRSGGIRPISLSVQYERANGSFSKNHLKVLYNIPGGYYSLVALLFLEGPSARWRSLRPDDSFGKLITC